MRATRVELARTPNCRGRVRVRWFPKPVRLPFSPRPHRRWTACHHGPGALVQPAGPFLWSRYSVTRPSFDGRSNETGTLLMARFLNNWLFANRYDIIVHRAHDLPFSSCARSVRRRLLPDGAHYFTISIINRSASASPRLLRVYRRARLNPAALTKLSWTAIVRSTRSTLTPDCVRDFMSETPVTLGVSEILVYPYRRTNAASDAEFAPLGNASNDNGSPRRNTRSKADLSNVGFFSTMSAVGDGVVAIADCGVAAVGCVAATCWGCVDSASKKCSNWDFTKSGSPSASNSASPIFTLIRWLFSIFQPLLRDHRTAVYISCGTLQEYLPKVMA